MLAYAYESQEHGTGIYPIFGDGHVLFHAWQETRKRGRLMGKRGTYVRQTWDGLRQFNFITL